MLKLFRRDNNLISIQNEKGICLTIGEIIAALNVFLERGYITNSSYLDVLTITIGNTISCVFPGKDKTVYYEVANLTGGEDIYPHQSYIYRRM